MENISQLALKNTGSTLVCGYQSDGYIIKSSRLFTAISAALLPGTKEVFMPATIDEILSAFSAELQQTSQRYTAFVRRAEAEGYPQLSRFFRAIVASEAVRLRLYRSAMDSHTREAQEYYICPYCGYMRIPDPPDVCPVNGTPGSQFEKIS